MIDIGFLPRGEAGTAELEREAELEPKIVNLTAGAANTRAIRQCPKCGAAALIHQEGCDLCTSCGHSRCV